VDGVREGLAEQAMMCRVTTSLGTTGAPAASRSARPGWRDPRLWVGILIVAASVVGGSRVLAAADDSVLVWAAAGDLAAGDRVAAGDLVATRVRFGSAVDLGHYFQAGQPPTGLQVRRGITAGELVARGAVGPAGDDALQQLPVAVDAEQVPPSVAAGSVVDVYLVPSPGGHCGTACGGTPVLSGVTVVDASSTDSGSFTTTGRRRLVLGVRAADAAAYIRALAADDQASVTVVAEG
jgi:hypothetical protein